MDPDALLAITGGLATALGVAGTWLGGKVRKTNAAASLPERLTAVEEWIAKVEADAAKEARDAHEATLAENIELKRKLSEFEDSSPAGSSQIMRRGSE